MQLKDHHSLSNFQDVYTSHLHLDLKINFENRIIDGIATHDINNINKSDYFMLDTIELDILKVELNPIAETTFKLSKKVQFLGRSLKIRIAKNTKQVIVHYKTTAASAGLQWLNPQQTHDKKHPFLFTQSEAILARSWIPCQDTPSIKFTYKAIVQTDPNFLVLMSAENPIQKSSSGMFSFNQSNPIPSYLMALAAGDIVYKSIDDRTGVYAEPTMIETALYEFSEMNKMMQIAEDLYGPYLWKKYDVIVLPPSFPFGGMENPMLTFATPTVIAGDRSLTSLIAHELAHSWSGNLVTNANWDDFWLNEGFTVYFERRIMEKLEGESYAEMLIDLGYQDLAETIIKIGKNHKDSCLKLDLKSRNPDDGMSLIAYEKGFFLLLLIEKMIGRGKFDKWIKQYFNNYAFKSMTTEKFIELVESQIIQNNTVLEEIINLREWIYKPGIPSNCPIIKSKRFSEIDEYITKWNNNIEFKFPAWKTQEYLHFLRNLPQTIPLDNLQKMDLKLGLTNHGNSEIFCLWALIAIKNNYAEIIHKLEEFLLKVGRRKFLLPIYTALLANKEFKKFAKSVYQKARDNYHFVSTNSLDKLLI